MNKKLNELAAITAMAALEVKQNKTYEDEVFEITNPYANIPNFNYSPLRNIGTHKTTMTKKQKKSRAKSKRAKKARRNK